ncbi:methyltransferase domain-containing protein [Mesorhizobium sp. M2A.F.Ca.ET.037.01.1.1]|uniref:class I SAM-dependent DNA methyltransferase n=1 Tax=unclassified Mesorhizobium TaxID=325217 RepID=UPI000F74E7B3|nr:MULTISPECIES: class I SAM-dependent methyltransferase [unclassified Mesorhizobium]RUY00858.1 methyltransferase domain-containing protein [Mesorhizobium sp. M2A.F.Ca.ET.040.01.1.1]RVC71025.1 methyltransferase domain-containing protein [Mesorhizobium sp. M00.F.Ca.ET.038.03.1.1]RVC79166.1 methyltransferase domain-containing protein [Mesorhizobium sp. M2A.F.Ca.ET.046.02.1.1]AZO34919.1 class I SAM-dependent methyltransferase [Mesorhizobium sp. M2A.F.Ca.ET.046.03.2.1]RUX22176.1 methyltransferase 
MTDGKHSGSLSAAYAAKRPDEVAAIYDRWSETYDADMSAAGYRHPTICLALLARHLPRGAEPLLDAGAGTGLIGEWLAITGYPRVEALDISQGMLDKAGAKGVYTALHRLAMGDTLPFADGAYAGIISAGVFTSGHVGVEGLDELIRICRPGGVIVLTVKNTLWDAGFEERIAGLEARGTLSRLEETRPYASMPGETDTVPSRGLVLRVN